MASALAWRLHRANLTRICMLDLAQPHCVRRTVSFASALLSGSTLVEGVAAVAVRDAAARDAAWACGKIAVARVEDAIGVKQPPPDIVIDAILAKRNLGTAKHEAPLVIALGPGFEAGVDCHYVIETNRGHHLGRVIVNGRAQPNTGDPGDIAGFTTARVLRAPAAGTFRSALEIGCAVRKGDEVGEVDGVPVRAALDGVLRGQIVPGTPVSAGMKLGDIDPRARPEYCHMISDKARAIAGAVLEAVLRDCNREPGLRPC
jgi:xanthine dehydrogenase accessory factor